MFLFKINFKIDKLFQLSESSMNTVFQLKEKKFWQFFHGLGFTGLNQIHLIVR